MAVCQGRQVAGVVVAVDPALCSQSWRHSAGVGIPRESPAARASCQSWGIARHRQLAEKVMPRAGWKRPLWVTLPLGAAAFIAYFWPKPWVVYTLPSGRHITHVVIGHFVVKYDDAILRLRYETELPLADTLALRQEALELWPRFRDAIRRGGYKSAAFYAEAPPTGFCYRHQGLCHCRGYGFPIRKNQDGRWYFADNDQLLP
jgi:hypothetical protein